MQDLAHPLAMRNRSAEAGKPAEQLDVVQQGVAESFRRLRKVKDGVFDDLCKIG
jgi:hypothetical protein